MRSLSCVVKRERERGGGRESGGERGRERGEGEREFISKLYMSMVFWYANNRTCIILVQFAANAVPGCSVEKHRPWFNSYMARGDLLSPPDDMRHCMALVHMQR